MADVKIRNLPDWLVEWHKRRAETEGVSLEERLRGLMSDSYEQTRKRLHQLSVELTAETRRKCGVLSDSTAEIRAVREEMERR
jgi:plasmid stability protein